MGSPQVVVSATEGRRNSSSEKNTSTSPTRPLLVSTPRRRRVLAEKSWKVV